MTKLHELLAVDSDLSGRAQRIMDEAKDTFTNKQDRFTGFYKSLRMFDDSREGENTDESKQVVTTVGEKLSHVRTMVGKHYDALLQKEMANTQAKSDIILDGEVIANDVPATFLLAMETRLKGLRQVVEFIPTLRPGFNWTERDDLGAGIFAANAPVSFKTEKFTDSRVLYEATKEHPAQIDTWNADRSIGRIEMEHLSGMITSAEKSRILTNVDNMIGAIKKARQRANTVEVENAKIADALFSRIF